jgi:lipid A 3-O-deacylase
VHRYASHCTACGTRGRASKGLGAACTFATCRLRISEVVSPRLFGGHTGFWSWFIPRLHLGGSVNLSERTSFAYTGLLWTANFTERTFFEIFVGPSVHNGFKDFQPPNMQALGCYVLVHSGFSLGYRLSERWSVLATYQHLSNASSLSRCHRNEGLDNLGIRLSYLF